MTKQTDVQLEARVAELELQLAALRAAAAPKAPSPPVEPYTTVLHGVAPRPRVPVEALPDDSQFMELQDAVLARYPVLVPQGLQALPMDQFHKQFRKCFEWLLTARRQNGLNNKYGVEYWIKQAASFHNEESFGLKPFLAAAVACGDIQYSTLDRLPYDLAVGLVYGAREAVVDLSAGWWGVLAGRFVDPTALYSSDIVRASRG